MGTSGKKSKQYFVTGLPRSRTKWFAEYLNTLTPGVICYHEALCGRKSREEFYAYMELGGLDRIGNSDSGLFITDFQQRWPDAPTLIIERPFADVYESLCALFAANDYPAPSREFLAIQHEQVNRLEGMRVAYEDIDRRMPEIHDYLGLPYNELHHARCKRQNIQIPELVADPEAYRLWMDIGA